MYTLIKRRVATIVASIALGLGTVSQVYSQNNVSVVSVTESQSFGDITKNYNQHSLSLLNNYSPLQLVYEDGINEENLLLDAQYELMEAVKNCTGLWGTHKSMLKQCRNIYYLTLPFGNPNVETSQILNRDHLVPSSLYKLLNEEGSGKRPKSENIRLILGDSVYNPDSALTINIPVTMHNNLLSTTWNNNSQPRLQWILERINATWPANEHRMTLRQRRPAGVQQIDGNVSSMEDFDYYVASYLMDDDPDMRCRGLSIYIADYMYGLTQENNIEWHKIPGHNHFNSQSESVRYSLSGAVLDYIGNTPIIPNAQDRRNCQNKVHSMWQNHVRQGL